MLIPTDPEAAFAAFLRRTQNRARTAEQLARAKQLGISPLDGSPLLTVKKVRFADGAPTIIGHALPYIAGFFYLEDHAEAALAQRSQDPSDVAAVAQTAASIQDAHAAALRLARELDESAHGAHVIEQIVRNVTSRRLVSGSSRPHAVDAEAPEAQRVERLAKPGSLRQLEPERFDVLKAMPMPRCNIPRPSDFEDPPPRILNPPGPFSTAQLIPQSVLEGVTAHGSRVRHLLGRAKRGVGGPQVARKLRPVPLIFTEDEALNPCGRGFVWCKRADQDLWDVVQPSSIDDPPDSSFKGKVFAADAKAYGMVDKQIVS